MVLVAAPTSDISDSDKDKLDAYLNEGGNLSLLMSPNAGAEAVRLLDWFLTELAARGLPVFAVSGNHDSADRIAFGAFNIFLSIK